MSRHDDQALLEAVRLHRGRLRGAFLTGTDGVRRGVSTLTGRLIASMVVAAVACGICVGVSFAMSIIAQNAAKPTSISSTEAPTP